MSRPRHSPAELVEESDERPAPELDDGRRRYYRLTIPGKRVLKAEAARLQQQVNAARAKRLIRGRSAHELTETKLRRARRACLPRVYRVLLLAYPPAFRKVFGAEMLAAFSPSRSPARPR